MDSDSDSSWGQSVYDPAAILFDFCDPLALFHRHDDTWIFADDVDPVCEAAGVDPDDPDAYVRWLSTLRLPRSTNTYEYTGDFLQAVNNTHADVNKRWSALPEWERDRRWIMNFRMYEEDFDDLYSLCEPHMREQKSRKDFRFYSKRTQLLVTVHFLAHCHTLRVVAEKFGMPHNSISRCCIHRGIEVLSYVLVRRSESKVIRWPRCDARLLSVTENYKAQYRGSSHPQTI